MVAVAVAFTADLNGVVEKGVGPSSGADDAVCCVVVVVVVDDVLDSDFPNMEDAASDLVCGTTTDCFTMLNPDGAFPFPFPL